MPVTRSARASLAGRETRRGAPFRCAPCPRAAVNISSRNGSNTAAARIPSASASPIDTPNNGTPWM